MKLFGDHNPLQRALCLNTYGQTQRRMQLSFLRSHGYCASTRVEEVFIPASTKTVLSMINDIWGLGANYIIHYPVPDDVGLGNSVLDKYITDYKQKLNLVWNKDNLFLYEYSSHE